MTLTKYLSQFVTENRNNQFDSVLQNRTKYLTVVLENIYHSHNANAVLRTCDSMGIQDVHIIENKTKFERNTVIAKGADKWLSITYHKNTLEAIEHLKENGYRIVATSPHKRDKALHKLNIPNGKIALFFGNELNGVSDDLMKHANEFIKIPMYGFSESLNISVCSGIAINHINEQIRSSDIDWQLSEKEKTDVKLLWLKNSIKKVELIEQKYLENIHDKNTIT